MRLVRLIAGSRAAVFASAVLLLGVGALGWIAFKSLRRTRSSGPRVLVLAGFGGSYGDALRRAVIEPFQKETGIAVHYDESCCARIGPMIEAGTFAGDIAVGVDYGGLLSWSRRGYLQEVPGLIAMSRSAGIPVQYQHPAMFIPTEYAYVMAAHGRDADVPHRWADFWDVKRYPGQRAFIRATPVGQLEAALLADGVTADRLYPLDVTRALASLERLRSSCPVIFANSPSDLVNLLARGDAKYAIAFSNRIEAARREGLPVAFSYQQGLRTGNGFGLLKGARDPVAAMAFFEFAGRPRIAARFAALAGLHPTTRDVGASDPRLAREIESSTVALSSAYWARNRDAVGEQWTRWLVH